MTRTRSLAGFGERIAEDGPAALRRRGYPVLRAAAGRRGTPVDGRGRQLRTPVLWGVVWGCLQAASPLAFFWLEGATVYALGLVLIAAVYIGFAVADGRGTVITVRWS